MEIKTQEEIEEKYKELNQRMADNMPTEESNKELQLLKGFDALEKMAKRSTDSISIDAQRYILEWVMGHHD